MVVAVAALELPKDWRDLVAAVVALELPKDLRDLAEAELPMEQVAVLVAAGGLR